MPNWDEVRKMITGAQTQKDKEDAARAMGEHIPTEHLDKHMVTLQKGGVHTVRLGELPQHMTTNPSIFERIRKIVGGK